MAKISPNTETPANYRYTMGANNTGYNSSNRLGVWGYGFNNTEQVTNSNQPDDNCAPKSPQEIEQKVKDILGATEFDKLSSDIQEDIVKKYELFKDVLKLNDTEIKNRLTNYKNALEAHKKELEMGKALINGKEYTGESIVDSNIKQQKKSGTDEEYANAILARGNGTVQLYDTNGDNKVDYKEFIKKEASDWKLVTGEDLDEDMKGETETTFKMLDKNNDKYLDSIELAAHTYARATLGNTEINTNEELTFKEFTSAGNIGSDEDITERYNYASKQAYDFLNQYKK